MTRHLGSGKLGRLVSHPHGVTTGSSAGRTIDGNERLWEKVVWPVVGTARALPGPGSWGDRR